MQVRLSRHVMDCTVNLTFQLYLHIDSLWRLHRHRVSLRRMPFGKPNFISANRILITVYVNRKLPMNSRTPVMCIISVPTILGFALVAWLPQHLKVGRLIGYCKMQQPNVQ
jgi:hypothetical protein